MKMTPGLVMIGSLMAFMGSVFAVIIVPAHTIRDQPSKNWRPLSALEQAGRKVYIENGCTYCHSQYMRPQDWDVGMERVSQSGDYLLQSPHLLGSTRNGPDLSQEAGEHPDDWQVAHLVNPRFTSPQSIMPRFDYLNVSKKQALIAYLQSLGGIEGDKRVRRQVEWKKQAIAAYQSGADANVKWLHDNIPAGWRPLPNPYPATAGSLARGEKVYKDFCFGCHGPGDGQGPAAPHLNPPPLNFNTLKRNMVDGKYIGGILYYQIMNGVTGTAMPYFKHHLESAKIWDVSNYVAVNFIGIDDSNTDPAGMDAAYEPLREDKPKSGKWSDHGRVDQ